MKIFVDDKGKTAEVWLTGAEQNYSALMESLDPLYSDWQQKKYKTIGFSSGHRDLAELTEGLLLHNRTMADRRDLEKEQQECGMTMTMGM